MYRGIYHDKRVHPPDVASVLSRAVAAGCHKLMITGSDLAESERAVALAREHRTSRLPVPPQLSLPDPCR